MGMVTGAGCASPKQRPRAKCTLRREHGLRRVRAPAKKKPETANAHEPSKRGRSPKDGKGTRHPSGRVAEPPAKNTGRRVGKNFLCSFRNVSVHEFRCHPAKTRTERVKDYHLWRGTVDGATPSLRTLTCFVRVLPPGLIVLVRWRIFA